MVSKLLCRASDNTVLVPSRGAVGGVSNRASYGKESLQVALIADYINSYISDQEQML